MRKNLHKSVDCICDVCLNIYRDFVTIHNHILCFFRKPKYKIGQIIYYPYSSPILYQKITNYYKNYSDNMIYYDLSCGYCFSEGLIDFYQLKKNKNENS